MSNVMEVANKTRDDTILDHWGYAATVAKNQGLDQKDMFVAIEALSLAVDSYNPSRGAKLKTYITNKVRFAVINHFRTIHGHRKRSRQEYLKVKFELMNAINIDDLESTDNNIDRGYYHHDYVDQYSSNGTEKKVTDKDMITKILTYTKSMSVPVHAYTCLNLFYLHDMDQPEIAKKIGISTSRVSFIIGDALKRIRVKAKYWR